MTRYPFPKIDLHLHLDGSLLPATMVELAAAQGVPLPADTPEGYLEYVREATGCGSVNRYLEVFEHPVAVMQDAGSITRITKELIELLASQGVAAAEIRMAPQLHTRRGLTQAEVEGRRQGLAACPDIKIGILLCMMCIGPEAVNHAANAETVEVAGRYLGQGVVGLDLAGAEGFDPLSAFAPLFYRAAELGIPFTCHAGDSQGPETVRDAMDFGARRIGHGHHIYDDPALVQRAIREGVTIEVCPTSNIQCRTQPSYALHPAKKLLDMGLAVTINTDNMTFAGVGLEDEYDHCLNEMGFTREDLIRMNINSVRASFLPQADKEELLRRLEACL